MSNPASIKTKTRGRGAGRPPVHMSTGYDMMLGGPKRFHLGDSQRTNIFPHSKRIKRDKKVSNIINYQNTSYVYQVYMSAASSWVIKCPSMSLAKSLVMYGTEPYVDFKTIATHMQKIHTCTYNFKTAHTIQIQIKHTTVVNINTPFGKDMKTWCLNTIQQCPDSH